MSNDTLLPVFSDHQINTILESLGFRHKPDGLYVGSWKYTGPDPMTVLGTITTTAQRNGRIFGLQEAQKMIAPLGRGSQVRDQINKRVEDVTNRKA